MKPSVSILYTHLIWQYLLIIESQQPFWQEIEALTFLFCWGPAESRYSCASGHAGKALLNGKEPFKMSWNSSHVCHCLPQKYLQSSLVAFPDLFVNIYVQSPAVIKSQHWIISPFCFILYFSFCHTYKWSVRANHFSMPFLTVWEWITIH